MHSHLPRHLLISLILLLCLGSAAHSATYYLGCSGTPAATPCTNKTAAPCDTLENLLDHMTAPGDIGEVEGNCPIYRNSLAATTHAAGTAGAHMTLRWDGVGTPPSFTQSTLLGGWTVHAGDIYKATPGFTVQEWGLTQNNLREDTINGQWDRQSFDVTNAANCPSTTILSFDHAWCQIGGIVYLRSTGGDPDTRYTTPGVEVVNAAVTNNQVLRLEHQYWDVTGSPTNNHLANADGMIFYLGQGIVLDVNAPRVTVAGVTIRDGIRVQGRMLRWYNDLGQPDMTGLVLRDFRIHRCGRDCLDLAGGVNFDGAALGDSVHIHHGEIAYTFDHGNINPTLAIGGTASTNVGTRRNILVEYVEEHDMCESIAFNSTQAIDTGVRGSMTIRHGYIHDGVNGLTDPRVPPTNALSLGSSGPAECATNPGPRGPAVRTTADITVEHTDISGLAHGVLLMSAAATVTVRDSTITNNTIGGITSTVNGGTITSERNIVAFNGTTTIGAASYQIGCTGNWPNVVFAGGSTTATENIYFQGAGTQFARCNNTSYDMAGWRARVNTTGDDNSVHADPLFVAENTDRNLQVGSVGLACDTGKDCGGYTVVTVGTCNTVDVNTWRCTANSLYTPVGADATKLLPKVNGGGSYTAANVVIEAAGAAIQFDIVGAPALVSTDTLTLDSDYCAIFSAPIFGLTLRGCRRDIDGKAVTNTIPAGGAVVPTYAGPCIVRDSANTVVEIPLNNGGAAISPASGATGFSCREATVAQTVSVNGVLTGNTYAVTFTDAFAAAAAIDCSYSPGNVTNSAGALTAFTNQVCTNDVSAPPPAPILVSGTVELVTPGTVTAQINTNVPPILPASGCTGLTLPPKTITNCVRTLNTQQTLTVTPSFIPSESRQLCYTSAGNITDSTSPTPVELADGCVTVTAPAAGSATYTSPTWQLFAPDTLATGATAVPLAAAGTLDGKTFKASTRLQLAATVEVATADAPDQAYALECQHNQESPTPTYRTVTTDFSSNSALRISSNTTASNGQACAASVLSSTACFYQVAPQGTLSTTLTNGARLTQVWNLEFATGLTATHTYTCRPVVGGQSIVPAIPITFTIGDLVQSFVRR